MEVFFNRILDPSGQGLVSRAEFILALEDSEFVGDTDFIFDCLDTEGVVSSRISKADLQWLETRGLWAALETEAGSDSEDPGVEPRLHEFAGFKDAN